MYALNGLRGYYNNYTYSPTVTTSVSCNTGKERLYCFSTDASHAILVNTSNKIGTVLYNGRLDPWEKLSEEVFSTARVFATDIPNSYSSAGPSFPIWKDPETPFYVYRFGSTRTSGTSGTFASARGSYDITDGSLITANLNTVDVAWPTTSDPELSGCADVDESWDGTSMNTSKNLCVAMTLTTSGDTNFYRKYVAIHDFDNDHHMLARLPASGSPISDIINVYQYTSSSDGRHIYIRLVDSSSKRLYAYVDTEYTEYDSRIGMDVHVLNFFTSESNEFVYGTAGENYFYCVEHEFTYNPSSSDYHDLTLFKYSHPTSTGGTPSLVEETYLLRVSTDYWAPGSVVLLPWEDIAVNKLP